MRTTFFTLGFFLSFFFLSSAFPAPAYSSEVDGRGEIVRVLKDRTKDEEIGEYYAIEYKTVDVHGKPTTATGLVAIPKTPWPQQMDWVSYQHGTQAAARDAPSTAPKEANDGAIAVATFLSHGFIVVAADGLGLGKYRGFHPYLHTATEASASADFLVAAKTLLLQKGVFMLRNLYLAGYSQGGQWTLALQRQLEEHPKKGIQISASFPMDGPYDLSETMFNHILHRGSTYTPFYSAYALFSMQGVYGGIVRDFSEAFVDEIAPKIPELFNGLHSNSAVQAALPNTTRELFKPEFLADVESNADHPLREALRKNDVYGWKPVAPVHLIHSKGDTEVPYENAVVAETAFRARGATVEIITTPGDLDHAAAFVPALAVVIQNISKKLSSPNFAVSRIEMKLQY